MRAAWALAAARRMSRGSRPLTRAMADTPATSRPPPPRPRAGAPRVVVLAGPTAVGKTAVSVALAKKLGGEIVNADSVAVYRGLDVGSAKPTLSERGGVPHHLLDVLDPGEDCSAGSFYSAARTAIEDILARGAVPIVVGGTGLYLRWLVHGRPATPASDADTTAAARAAVDAAVAAAEEKAGRKLNDAERWAAASSALATAGDPASAARIGAEPNNEYRLLRALEVVLATGAPREAALVRRVGGDGGGSDTLDYDFRAFFLHADRVATYRRIDARAEAMLASGGLVKETAAMLASGLRTDASCALRAIGYRHAAEAIENAAARAAAPRAGGAPPPPPTPADGVALWSGVAAASRRLAHSQYMWFRGDALYRWVDVKGGAPDAIASTLATLIQAPSHDPGPPAAGRLTAAQESALKRYMPELTVLAEDDALARVAGDVAAAADALPPTARTAAVAAGAARAAKLEEQRVMTVAAEAVKRQARQARRGDGRRDW